MLSMYFDFKLFLLLRLESRKQWMCSISSCNSKTHTLALWLLFCSTFLCAKEKFKFIVLLVHIYFYSHLFSFFSCNSKRQVLALWFLFWSMFICTQEKRNPIVLLIHIYFYSLLAILKHRFVVFKLTLW